MTRASLARRHPAALLHLAAFGLGTSFALAAPPNVCVHGDAWPAVAGRAPAAVAAYIGGLDGDRFDLRAACAHWAGTFSRRHQSVAKLPRTSNPPQPRFILFPTRGRGVDDFAAWVERVGPVLRIERTRTFVVATFSRHVSTARLLSVLNAPEVEYSEPDCDGPDFLTTSMEPLPPQSTFRCWQRTARDSFPNDPCMDELWGHAKIGWDSTIAAHSLPRLVAVLDSGINAAHEDLARTVLRVDAREPPRSQGRALNMHCATSGRCYPHGTEMAGTIGGRMDNGIGIAGVAPNSRLMSIVIGRVESSLLSRLSTIAEGIEAAARNGADVINISAKWPVDSRAISDAIRTAVGGEEVRRRIVVTGYATSLDFDDSVREYFPSRYRCLPGVLSAVPADMRGHDLFNPQVLPNANDGRIQAPGVDIVVTTNENSERGYALSGAAGASSAAAYVSGVVALVWGSPPLDTCDAQQIKRLLFCRSKTSDSTRYPWIHVDFLRELAKVDSSADCGAAMEALGCH